MEGKLHLGRTVSETLQAHRDEASSVRRFQQGVTLPKLMFIKCRICITRYNNRNGGLLSGVNSLDLSVVGKKTVPRECLDALS